MPLYAPARTLRLANRDVGSGSPVVLLHGLGDSRDLWRHQFPVLAPRFRTIALDLRGHGGSPLGTPDFTLADMADDVRGTLHGLGVREAVVIGLSLGGGVAQVLAIRHPTLVRALVLVSTSSEFHEETYRRFVDRAGLAEREGMAAVVDATVPRWFSPAFMASHPDEVARTRHNVLAIEPKAFAAASRANAARRLTGDLRSISCPVLFIAGADDPADPPRAIAIYRREIRDFRSKVIPGASHLVPVEAPDVFNHLVLRFLNETEPTSPPSAGGTP